MPPRPDAKATSRTRERGGASATTAIAVGWLAGSSLASSAGSGPLASAPGRSICPLSGGAAAASLSSGSSNSTGPGGGASISTTMSSPSSGGPAGLDMG